MSCNLFRQVEGTKNLGGADPSQLSVLRRRDILQRHNLIFALFIGWCSPAYRQIYQSHLKESVFVGLVAFALGPSTATECQVSWLQFTQNLLTPYVLCLSCDPLEFVSPFIISCFLRCYSKTQELNTQNRNIICLQY